MKKATFFLMACIGVTAWATPLASSEADSSSLPTPEMREEERARLALARQQLEADYQSALKQCYQLFDFTSCRLQARDRRIEANQALRKEELRFNAIERQVQAEEARSRLADRNSEASRKDADVQRAQAVTAARERSDANAQKQIDHALQGTKRGEYEQKQREAAQHRADVEKKLRERTKEPAAPLPVPTQ